MKADYLTYRTATGASLRGMLIQAALAVAIFVYALLSRDHAAMSMAIFATIGIFVWLALWVLFDQHRRERIEALEAEALSQSGGPSTSVFQTSTELRPAAARLASLYKFFVPALSIVLAGVLLYFGITRLADVQTNLRFLPADPTKPGTGYNPPLHANWAMAMGISCAVLGFVYARYAAGMSKQIAWANLRAGAAFSVGTAIMGLLLAVAHVVDYLGPDHLTRFLVWIAGAVLVLVGVEILFNLVLLVYRPRKSGEIPKVAFDSRLLGFAAAPDRIAKSISEAVNYQLGFDVTSGWLYQLLSRALLPLIAAGLGIVWILSCFVVIQPHQRAIVLRSGRFDREIGPGLELKYPWPFETTYVPEYFSRDARGRLTVSDRTVTGLRTLNIGTSPSAATDVILWTNDHAGEEVYQFVRATGQDAASLTPVPADSTAVKQALGIGSLATNELADLAMVSAELPLHYIVSDVRHYDEFAAPEQRDELLRAAAVRETTLFFQRTTLDQALGYGRVSISDNLRERIQAAFDGLNPGPDGVARGAGVKVVYVGVSGVHPPKDTAASFEATVMADARKIANIQNAEADAVATLTGSVGDAKLAGQIVAELNASDSLRAGEKVTPEAIASQEDKVARLIDSAGGKAASVLAKARAERWKQHMGLRGQATRYAGQSSLYNAAPLVFRAEQSFKALSSVLNGAKLVVVGEGVGTTRMDVNLEDQDLGVDPFLAKKEGE